MNTFYFCIGALATYRITVLIARDVGPWGVFQKLRKVARFSKLLSCPFCVSLWAGALVLFIQYLARIDTGFVLSILFVLSYSAIAVILDRCFTADHAPK